MTLRREREAYAAWEKAQWAAGKVPRKVRDRQKAARPEPPASVEAVRRHPAAGARDQVLAGLERATVEARKRGRTRVARKARAWR